MFLHGDVGDFIACKNELFALLYTCKNFSDTVLVHKFVNNSPWWHRRTGQQLCWPMSFPGNHRRLRPTRLLDATRFVDVFTKSCTSVLSSYR
jgi:hypothetical protein